MAIADENVLGKLEGDDTEDVGQVWRDVLDHLRTRVRKDGFETWLAATSARRIKNGTVEVEVPNALFADWIAQHYGAEIRAAVLAVTNRDLAVCFLPRDSAEGSLVRHRSYSKGERGAGLGTTRLQARYTFENFVVGESNRFAAAACQSVAEKPGQRYNPLFIYGGVGLGKTHLLQAIGNYCLTTRRSFRVHYVAAETLFTELIQAIASDTRLDFKNKYRNLELLLLDDIHYLVGKERLQEEVFHIFNHLHDNGSQVVFTSDRPPKDIPTLEERLISRLGSGLVVDIQPPDLETRMAILKRKAAQEQVELPEDVAYFIATRITDSVRALEGSLIRLLAVSSILGTPVTIEVAQQVLKDLVREEQPVNQNQILTMVANHFGVAVRDLASPVRTHQLVLARQVAMYLLRTRLNLSLKEIGHLFGGKDHSTVLHAITKVQALIARDPSFSSQLEQLKKALRVS